MIKDILLLLQIGLSHIYKTLMLLNLLLSGTVFLAASVGCNLVEVESNCLFAVDTLNSMDYLGPHVAIVADCNQLAMEFGGISFKHLLP